MALEAQTSAVTPSKCQDKKKGEMLLKIFFLQENQ
jgi:hypothetical protein